MHLRSLGQHPVLFHPEFPLSSPVVGWGRAAVAEDLAACSPFVPTRASLTVQQVKEFTCGRHRRPGFDPWVRKIPWRKKIP